MAKLLSNSKPLYQSLIGIAIASVCGLVYAQPAQVPLLSRSGDQGKPNVMFTLDDSGSMELMNMPDEMAIGIRTDGGFTFGTSVRTGMHPGDSNSTPYWRDRFIGTAADSLVSARWRSSGINTVYYNPEIQYIPWVDFDDQPVANANPTAAQVNALIPWSAVVNLTGSSVINDRWCLDWNDSCQDQNHDFAPATYFDYNGGDPLDINSFTRVRIMDAASFDRGGAREDCALDHPSIPGGKLCSQAEEYQNFANWYTYYRKRMYTAIAGVSRAFASQSDNIRLGWGRINKGWGSVDGVGTNTVVNGVRDFGGTNRLNYFNWLFAQDGVGGTPLRRAMGSVGEYYRRDDNQGPWSNSPGTGSSGTKLACRKAYHILMSDGYWNGSAAAGAANSNVDSLTGPQIFGPGAAQYQYTPVAPFYDTTGQTLADVAMYYWNRDLVPSLENRVRQDVDNPAFWQNLVQFTVGLGVNGTLNQDTDYQGLADGSVTWPSPFSNERAKIDDMWHAAINSRGEFLSAADPEQFSNALSEILRSIGQRESAEGGSAVSSVTLEAASEKYIPTYKASTWSGDVQAKRIDINGAAVSDIWRASEHLPAPAARNIWLGTGTNGSVVFNYTNLIAKGPARVDSSVNADMVAYMRGDRTTGEGTVFRQRDPRTVLGDMVNSQPLLIGGLIDEQYQFLPESTMGTERGSYRNFINQKKSRQEVVIVGANDGKLHAFNANTGVEEYAFVPDGVVEKLHMPADINYQHQFMVDGPMVEVDIYKGGWKNYVIGSLGAGGTSIFAMDVTNTSNLGSNTAQWEFSHPELGYVMAPVATGVTQSGDWIAVTGNGMDSTSGYAQLFIINARTGTLLKKISTNTGSGNGLGGVSLVKDVNNVVVAAYAGDQKGNVWRFDLIGDSSQWEIGFDGNPLFKTNSGASEPITGQPEYLTHPQGGQLVVFGTGRLYQESDITGLTATQRLYGVWDQTPADQDSIGGDEIPTGASLQPQSFTGSAGGNAVVFGSTSYTVDWSYQRGWYLNLSLASGQRSIYTPQLVRGFILFNTIAPGPDSGQPCDDSPALGYNIIVNALTGGAPKSPLIDTNSDGLINEDDALSSTYETVADGIDRIMLGENGEVSLQGAFLHRNVNIEGRALERIWRVLMNPPTN